jgi:hypothetical protein
VGSTPTVSASRKGAAHLTSDTSEILLQFLMQQQRMICELCRNDLLLIESILSGQAPEGLAAAAATIRATLYSVDSLGDKIQQLDSQTRGR